MYGNLLILLFYTLQPLRSRPTLVIIQRYNITAVIIMDGCSRFALKSTQSVHVWIHYGRCEEYTLQ